MILILKLVFLFLNIFQSNLEKDYLKEHTIIWGNVAIDGTVKVHNDVVDRDNIEEPDSMMKDLNIYNLMYNNSATDKINNLNIFYIQNFQDRSGINIDRLIINVPRNYIKESENLEKITKFIEDAESSNIKIYGFLFDDFADGFLTENELKKTVEIVKNKNSEIKIIGVYYYKDILQCLYEMEKFSKEKDINKREILNKISSADKYFDEYTLWFWNLNEEKQFDFFLNEAKKILPGKPMSVGIYLNNYSPKGTSSIGVPLKGSIFNTLFVSARKLVVSKQAKDLYILSSYWYGDDRFSNLREYLRAYYK